MTIDIVVMVWYYDTIPDVVHLVTANIASFLLFEFLGFNYHFVILGQFSL